MSFDLRDTTNSTPGTFSVAVISVEDDLAPIASLEVVGADTLLEGGDDATLRVTLDRAFDQETTIQIVTDGTATQGEDRDYTITVNPVTLSANSTYAETTLKIIDDFEVEPDETIILRLDAHNNQIIDDIDLDREPLMLTIADNDIPAAIMFEQAAYTIIEGTSRTITLRADPPPLVKIQIRLTTGSETTLSAGGYQLSTTIVTFEPSRSTASFVVSITEDKCFPTRRPEIIFVF